MVEIDSKKEQAIRNAYLLLEGLGLNVGVTLGGNQLFSKGHDFESADELVHFLRTGEIPKE